MPLLLLDRRESMIQEASVRSSFTFGTEALSRASLENVRAEGRKTALHIAGSLTIASDVTPDLARATIESVWVRSVFRAPTDVKDALKDRTR